MNFDQELSQSVQYLSSKEAIKALNEDNYWPKWNSPWWHMLLLHEMGETKQIPQIAIEKYIEKQNQIPLKIFPIQPEDMPAHIDPYRGTPCHCQLGNAYQVLSAFGVDVDKEIPWIRPWFLKYQMPDGGLNCDNDAYLVKDEVPSSMVGTIPGFEALVLYTNRPYTHEEKNYLDKAAQFLIDRKLMMGSNTKHNASERQSAEKWFQLCFPRYYFYDVLRGLNALLAWSDKTGGVIPKESIQDVVQFLENKFSDGRVYPERHGFEGTGTILQNAEGEWIRRQPASFFPLLNKVSTLNTPSPFLTSQWKKVKEQLSKMDFQ